MKTIQSILVFASVCFVAGCATQSKIPIADEQRPVLSSLPAKHQAVLRTWLKQDCRVDSLSIEKDMASAGPILEGALWEAYNLGPQEKERADLQRSLGDRYVLRLRGLKRNGLEAVKSPAYQDLLAESEDQFRATEMAKLIGRWRDAAINGLGFTCTARSLEHLRLIAKDNHDPSSIAASEALKASGNCGRFPNEVPR